MIEPTPETKASDTVRLKPCPFCGGEPGFREGHRNHWRVVCTKCGVEHPTLVVGEIDPKPKLVVAWNTRPLSLPKGEDLKAIADRLDDQRDEPWPGSDADRLHYWRDKAIMAARELAALLAPLSTGEREKALTLNDVEAQTLELMERAAKRDGLSVSDWVAKRMKEAAERALSTPLSDKTA